MYTNVKRNEANRGRACFHSVSELCSFGVVLNSHLRFLSPCLEPAAEFRIELRKTYLLLWLKVGLTGKLLKQLRERLYADLF